MSGHDQHKTFDPTCGECAQDAAVEGFGGGSGPDAPLVIIDVAQNPILSIHADGRVTLDQPDKADEAARVFARSVQDLLLRVPVEDQAIIDSAPPEVSKIANAIGYVLAKRGARFTADDVIAAAYRVADQSPAVRVTEATVAAAKPGTESDEQAGEAHINGEMSFDDVRAALEKALRTRLTSDMSTDYCWAYVADLTATDVVYSMQGDLFQCSYEIDAAGNVTLGDAAQVVRTYAPSPDDEPGDEGQADDMAAAEAGAGWSADKHPRGKKGAANGGKFVSLSYDSKAKTGTGYDRKAGDPRVKELQRALNRLGMTDGKGSKLEVDGKLGPLTTGATRKAQRQLGLPATGKVTPELLSKLTKAKRLAKPKPKPGTPAAKPGAKSTAKPAAPKKGAKEAEDAEERTRMVGRILEARGEAEDGGRIYRVRIIAYGESKNARSYPEAVMREAAQLYDGARAYDHHRTEAELASSTITGLVGSYRNVEATAEGIDADLHLLPSAVHAAEALDATLAAQEDGLPPLIGLSHDVMAKFRPVVAGGRRLQEATAITKVHSADLVADPAAGGQATRAVAGGTDGTGTEPAENEEDDVPPTKEDILGALAEATNEELAGVGLSRAAEAGEQGKRETEAAGEPKTGFLGSLMIREKVKGAGLPEAVIEGVTNALPDRIVEADVDNQIAALKATMGIAERAGLVPEAGTVQVTQEARDKKVKALDAFFSKNWTEGYRSFRQAFEDITGARPRAWDEDFNRTILQESFGGGFHSGQRASESMTSASWAQVLGDSVTRRMVAMYALPSLQTWRAMVSSIVPVNDFRTQHVGRVGGYGVLPDVNESAPYQPLDSPGDEEATWAPTKKGGTEDLTLEMVANDDIRAISNIPQKLGRAAAQTLYRFVWDFIRTNATCTYDSTTLFHNNHANLGSTALGTGSLAAARQALMEQTAYDDDTELLDLDIRNLIVPPALYDLAYRLTKSAVFLNTNEDGTSPNVNQGINLISVPYFTSDDNNWYVTADPQMVPTIEVGFYQGRQDPELFTQSDPNVGSVFDSDKITYKIRHIYGGTVLDHRGMYGALVA